MAQAFGGKIPVTIEYKLDVDHAIVAFDTLAYGLKAMAEQAATAARALRELSAELEQRTPCAFAAPVDGGEVLRCDVPSLADSDYCDLHRPSSVKAEPKGGSDE